MKSYSFYKDVNEIKNKEHKYVARVIRFIGGGYSWDIKDDSSKPIIALNHDDGPIDIVITSITCDKNNIVHIWGYQVGGYCKDDPIYEWDVDDVFAGHLSSVLDFIKLPALDQEKTILTEHEAGYLKKKVIGFFNNHKEIFVIQKEYEFFEFGMYNNGDCFIAMYSESEDIFITI